MPKSLKPRLLDLLDAIAGVQGTAGHMELELYRNSWQARRATERGIEIISEASRHIPDDLKARFPEVPWRQIAAIGNVLRHEYQRVEDQIVWNVAREHLQTLPFQDRLGRCNLRAAYQPHD